VPKEVDLESIITRLRTFRKFPNWAAHNSKAQATQIARDHDLEFDELISMIAAHPGGKAILAELFD